jgi:hypothetical protein
MGTYDTRGGTPRHDPAADVFPACELCGHDASDCICPECPVCSATGDPKCYGEHFRPASSWLCLRGHHHPTLQSQIACNRRNESRDVATDSVAKSDE